MELAIAIDFATLLPRMPDEFGLARIFPGPLAQRVLEPSVETARMDAQATAHRPHRKQGAMLSDERAPHLASLAKYAVAFFRISRSSVTRAI